MDRLYGTLEDKISSWEEVMAMTKGCCGLSENNPQMRELLKERLLVAYDLTSAFHYLHNLKRVSRNRIGMMSIQSPNTFSLVPFLSFVY
jgi:hypothetical protein